jgi:hypothetical protein
MPLRFVMSVLAAAALASGLSAQTPASAQAPSSAGAPAGRAAWSVPRMPDGKPDMQGVWANNGMTPLERPSVWGNRATMTDAELADLKKRAQQLIDGGDAFFADELILAALEGKTKFSSADTQTGNYDQSWLSERIWDNRTSLIIDPPDGRIPPAAAGAAERARAQAAARLARGPADRPQDLSMSTRCVSAGTPYIRAGYQSYFDVTQGPGVVVLRSEMIHDARIFQVGGGPHLSSAIRQYHGDSRAHWDGDTLVVDTINFSNSGFRGSTDALHLTEKLRRTAEDTLEYHITIDDPTLWSRPWTLMIPLKKTGEQMFEFACHEGNYGLPAILSGARAQEQSSR